MSTFVATSPAFRDDPRGWTTAMIDRLMKPGLALSERDRETLVKKRRLFATYPERVPGPHLYEQLCRIARACGVLAKRPQRKAVAEAPLLVSAPAPIPPRFALGACIPKPPPLRRPVALVEPPETWDPAGMPGL